MEYKLLQYLAESISPHPLELFLARNEEYSVPELPVVLHGAVVAELVAGRDHIPLQGFQVHANLFLQQRGAQLRKNTKAWTIFVWRYKI